MDYSSLDFQVTRPSETSPFKYCASILKDGNIMASSDFELRQDLKLKEMLEAIEKRVIEGPATSKKQIGIMETAQIFGENTREEPHVKFGKMLYSTVFSGELGEYFDKSRQEAQENDNGLRISLRFDEKVPEIVSLPWEYLHDGEEFLVARRSILISRLPDGVKKKSLAPLDTALRMLAIISVPDGPGITPLNTEKEQEIILEAVDKLARNQKIKVDFTEDATFDNIQDHLTENDYHIVHFTGHGTIIDGKGHLVFENKDQKPAYVDNKTLSDLFSEREIRLVVLSSCESAKGSNKEAFGDLASMLSRRGIPAVVAMQYSVIDEVATNFAKRFYKTISSGKPVDVALKEARLEMKNNEKSNGLDFATPVIYLSDPKCVQLGNLKQEATEFVLKPSIISDLQVMEKGFVARRKELRLLEKGFKSDVKRTAIIYGFGGIGKTVLATRFALKMSDYFEGTLGIKCTSTTRPEDLLNKFNSFLLMKQRSELNQILNQQVPLEVKTSVLTSILNQIRFLIIFDNFEDCLNEARNYIENPDLKAFISQLLNNTSRNTKFIITTRYDFDPLDSRLSSAIEHVSLPELHFTQANWLMNNFTELEDLGIPKKKEIYDVIGGHPWTIGQFAALVSSQGVDDLLIELEPLQKQLIEFTLLEKTYSNLDLDARKLLLYASIYEDAVPVEALSWIVGDGKNIPSVADPLKKLLQWGLISKEQDYGKIVYSEHKIVKDFSRKKLEENELDEQQLLIMAAQYYVTFANQTENIWYILKARKYYFQAEDWESANEIVEATIDTLILWGYIELAIDLLEETIDKASGDTRTRAEYVLATVYYRLGDLNSALEIYNDIKYKYEERGDYRGVAVLLHAIAMIHQDQGEYEEAVKKYTQSLKIAEELGDKSGIAQTLHQLGNVHYLQGEYEEAVKKYTQSLKIAEEFGDKSGIAITLHQLGMIHQDQGEYEEAVKKYTQSLKIAEELGDKSGIAQTLLQLGNVHYLQGEYEEAVKKYTQSLRIKEELGDKSGISLTLHGLGMIHQDQGEYEEAVKKYTQSLKIKEKLGDKRGIAQMLHQLGMIHQDQGEYEEAVKKYTQSLKIKEELGDKSGIAQTLHQLGNVHYLQGEYEEAVEKYNQSLKIAEELGDKSGIAQTLHQLGMINEEEEDFSSALSKYVTSFSIFEWLNSPNKEIVEGSLSRLRDKMGEEKFNAEMERLVN